MKKGLKALLLAAVISITPLTATYAASEGSYPPAPINSKDQASLQRGAQIFVNYCLSCHSASSMRYNRLMDLGLTEKQITENFIFTDAKIGDTMVSSMDIKDATSWFGAAPPDLTLIARSKGADYLYAYLRGFYQDPTRATGWNNTVFDKVGMPHVLWEQQGIQEVELDEQGQPIMVDDGHGVQVPKIKWVQPGLQSKLKADGTVDTAKYDQYVADLVNYLVYMGEPAGLYRAKIGYIVLLFLLLIMLPLAYFLKKEYWKDIHD